MASQSKRPDLAERVRVMFEEADRAEFDTALGFYAEDAVWVMADEIATFEGVDAIREHWEEWYAAYEDFRFEARDIAELGNGVVFAVARQGGRLGGGRGALSQELALVYEWSDDLIVRVRAFFDIDRARV